MREKIVQFDVDDAEYVGDGEDGCYYQTAEGPNGWYVTVVVDSNTGSFVDNLITDDGPYRSDEEAGQAGKYLSRDWCNMNEVDFTED